MARPRKISQEELAREVEGQESYKIVSAVNTLGTDKEIEIKDHEGRKLKIKAKKISSDEAVDDSKEYS